MKIKTSELEGSALDYAVSVCEDLNIETQAHPIEDCMCVMYFDRRSSGIFNPSNEWAQAGPIIEREKRDIKWSDHFNGWFGVVHIGIVPYTFAGDTYLEAAMRCYVASKLGDEVEIPDVLL